jgi:hypothetical protein
LDREQARLRLGLDEDTSPPAVLRAHHRAALAAVQLSPELRASVLNGLDQARDTLLATTEDASDARLAGTAPEAKTTLLAGLATKEGAALLAAAGVALTALSTLTDAPASILGPLAVIALAAALVGSVRRRNRVASALLALAVITSVVLETRAVTSPERHEFLYADSSFLYQAPSTSPFPGETGIPLTADPASGRVDATVIENATFVISCVRQGTSPHRRHVLWAYVADGAYQTYWIPWGYLHALQPGAARALLNCSDWRWQLQNFGSP